MAIKVAINGYGTIGKRVADAVSAQDDMTVIGVTKTRPSFGCERAVRMGYPLYATSDDEDRIQAFATSPYPCEGGVTALLERADVVIDCAPGKVGAMNLELYRRVGVRHILQGGEKHEAVGMSYSSCANHGENMGAKATRVVSCNTTGLARSLVPIIESVGHIDVEVTLIRRAADPGDSTRGPINAIAPVLKVPSHHGPDLITVTEGVSITSLAVAVPTTIMHVHAVSVRLPEDHGLDTRAVLDLWSTSPRLLMMDGAMDGIRTTAEVMEMARDLGRTWGDLHEIFIWKDGVRLEGRRLHYFQAIHQESDVVPENVDAVRALMGTESDWRAYVARTDRNIAASFGRPIHRNMVD